MYLQIFTRKKSRSRQVKIIQILICNCSKDVMKVQLTYTCPGWKYNSPIHVPGESTTHLYMSRVYLFKYQIKGEKKQLSIKSDWTKSIVSHLGWYSKKTKQKNSVLNWFISQHPRNMVWFLQTLYSTSKDWKSISWLQNISNDKYKQCLHDHVRCLLEFDCRCGD